MIYSTLSSLLDRIDSAAESDLAPPTSFELENQFHAIRRLVASKAGFSAFTHLPRFRERIGMKVVRSLGRHDEAITHAAIDMLSALLQPMHDDYELYQEQLNKSSLLSSKKFLSNLIDIFEQYVVSAARRVSKHISSLLATR